MIRGGRLAIAVLVLAVLSAGPAARAEQAVTLPTLEAVRALILSGHFDAAIAVLGQYLKLSPDDVEGHFLLGFAETGAGEYDKAEDEFNRLLVEYPDRARIRLELARALFLAGRYEDAQYQFELVLSGDIPPEVRANVLGFLDQIRRRRRYQYALSAAIAPSSNINNATSASQVSVYGEPATLSANARRQSGVGVVAGGQGEREAPLWDSVRLRLGAAGYDRDYPGGQFDDRFGRVYAGLQHLDNAGDASLLAVTDRRWYGGPRYDDREGLRLEYDHVIDQRWTLGAWTETLRDWFESVPGMSGSEYDATLAPRYTLNATTTLGAQLTLGVLQGVVSYNGYHAQGIGGFYQQEFAHGVNLTVTPQFQVTSYAGPNPLFGIEREDRAISLQVTLADRAWRVHDLIPFLGVSHIDNRSNIALYAFTGNQVLFGFTRGY